MWIIMYLIAGLGNPGKKYEYTRHNVGFIAMDYIAEKLGVKIKKIKFSALIAECVIGGEKCVLAKPSTFMNASGESIIKISDYYKIPAENIIIINDDISIPVGRLRIRPSGSDGGHNGLKSIIYHLHSDNFTRIKIGVGGPDGDLVNHVLGEFSKEDGVCVTKCIKECDKIVELIINHGVQKAMNDYNGFGKEL